jgi:uncharacterized protein with HEPN domain
MIDYAEEAIQLLGALDAIQLQADRRTFLAVSRCVEVVGEAGWKLSDAIKAAHTEIPWPLIAGMRHRLVHDYGRVDFIVVHRVIVAHLPLLISQLRAILAARTT